jgi:metal-responsive CopG/Arc/MetJ family transcriptional regulator
MPRAAEQSWVSLPPHLVEWIDQKAREAGSSRSRAVAQVLEECRRKEWTDLSRQGCREFAGEMAAAAAETHAAQAEVALREPFDGDQAWRS